MEFTILKNSEVRSENPTYRIDAEYFKKEYLDVITLVESNDFSYLGDITSWITQGPNPTFSEIGLPCLTGRNINKGEVSYCNPDFVDDEEYKKLARYQLNIGDTLITLKGKGSIGKIGYVTNGKKAIFSRDIGIVRPSDINPGYLNVFILCKYGKLLVDRGETGGTGQSTLTTSYLKAIPVPRFTIENTIGDFLERVEELRVKSRQKYKEARNILLSELGLDNWQPKHQLSFVKKYSDTKQAERIDAEYYQPRYDQILSALWSRGGVPLHKVASVRKGYQARSVLGIIPYASIKNINDNIVETNEFAGYSNKLITIGLNDLALTITGATIGKVGINLNKQKVAICGDLLRITAKDISPYYLLAVLDLPILTDLCKRNITGMTNGHLSPDIVNKFPIPLLDKKVMKSIDNKVAKSFSLRKQAEDMLEYAKRAVEIAIEQDEEMASKWLKQHA